MKRLLSIILTITLCLTIFTSCGRQPEEFPQESETTTAATTTSVTTVPESEDEYYVTSWTDEDGMVIVEETYVSGNGTTINRYTLRPSYKTVDEVQAEYPGKTVLVWSEYYTSFDTLRIDEVNEYLCSLGKDYVICYAPFEYNSGGETCQEIIASKLDSGEQIDILTRTTILTTSSSVSAYYDDIYLGLLAPLDEYFECSEDAMEYYNSMPESYWDAFRVNGKLYAFGGFDLGIKSTDNYYYLVNADLAVEYGWDFDKTIGEQIDIIKMVVDEKGNNGITLYYSGFGQAFTFAKIQGVAYDSDTETIINFADSDKFVESLSRFYNFKDSGILSNFSVADGYSDSFIRVYTGNSVKNYISEDPVYLENGDECIEYIPVLGSYTYSSADGGIGICSASSHKEEAFDFILLTQTDSYLSNLLTYGIEGEDYSIVDGVSNITPSLIKYTGFANPLISLPFGSMPQDMNELYAEILENAQPADASEAVGFAFDVRGYEELYQAVKLAVQNHSYLGYSTFEADLAALQSELEEAGIDELLEEINRQYAEWRANNYD